MTPSAPIAIAPAVTRTALSGPTNATASTGDDQLGYTALRARAERMLRAHPVASIAVGAVLGLVLARVLR